MYNLFFESESEVWGKWLAKIETFLFYVLNYRNSKSKSRLFESVGGDYKFLIRNQFFLIEQRKWIRLTKRTNNMNAT